MEITDDTIISHGRGDQPDGLADMWKQVIEDTIASKMENIFGDDLLCHPYIPTVHDSLSPLGPPPPPPPDPGEPVINKGHYAPVRRRPPATHTRQIPCAVLAITSISVLRASTV